MKIVIKRITGNRVALRDIALDFLVGKPSFIKKAEMAAYNVKKNLKLWETSYDAPLSLIKQSKEDADLIQCWVSSDIGLSVTLFVDNQKALDYALKSLGKGVDKIENKTTFKVNI